VVTDPLRHNANLVESLGSALRSSEHGLSAVPGLLRQVLADESWREFVTQLGDHVTHERFTDFVETPPLEGLGSDVDMVRRVVADDPELLDLLDQALARRQGERTDLSHNRSEVKRRQGTTKEQALRRLRKDRPDLHQRVLAGDLSPHRAMVEAGFRRRTVSVPVDDAEATAGTLRRQMSPEALERLKELL
jgi:hypothetical protein